MTHPPERAMPEQTIKVLADALCSAASIGIATILVRVGTYDTLSPYMKKQWDLLAEFHKLSAEHGAWDAAALPGEQQIKGAQQPTLDQMLAQWRGYFDDIEDDARILNSQKASSAVEGIRIVAEQGRNSIDAFKERSKASSFKCESGSVCIALNVCGEAGHCVAAPAARALPGEQQIKGVQQKAPGQPSWCNKEFCDWPNCGSQCSSHAAAPPSSERAARSLLRKPGSPLPHGCYCQLGKCGAPKPEWCRDSRKRDGLTPNKDDERAEQADVPAFTAGLAGNTSRIVMPGYRGEHDPERCRLLDGKMLGDRPHWRCHKTAGHKGACSSDNDCGELSPERVTCGLPPEHEGPHAWERAEAAQGAMETPETDAATLDRNDYWRNPDESGSAFYVAYEDYEGLRDVSRSLERRLREAESRIEERIAEYRENGERLMRAADGWKAEAERLRGAERALTAAEERINGLERDCEAFMERSVAFQEHAARLEERIKALTEERDRLAEQVRGMRELLERLHAVQNGCPLPKYREEWETVMREIEALQESKHD